MDEIRKAIQARRAQQQKHMENQLNQRYPEQHGVEDEMQKAATCEQLYKEEQYEMIEKGKSLPVGTIRKRPNGNFIKTANGWKYHSSANSGGSKSSEKSAPKKKSGLPKEIGKFLDAHKLNDSEIADTDYVAELIDNYFDNNGFPEVEESKLEAMAKQYQQSKGKKSSAKKEHTFEEVLADEEGKRIVESIEHLDADNPDHKELYEDSVKQLKDKFGFDYNGGDEWSDKQKKEFQEAYKKQSGKIKDKLDQGKKELEEESKKKSKKDQRRENVQKKASSVVKDFKSLQEHFSGQEIKSSGNFDIHHTIGGTPTNPTLEVHVNGKRGYVREAERKAMSASLPKLPEGFEYKDRVAKDYNGSKMTEKSIREADEKYDDRGYTDSEFYASAKYDIVRSKNAK